MNVSPVAITLCGSPSVLACDTTIAGVLKDEIIENGVGGGALRPIIQAIREEPWRYYLQVNTGAYPLGEITGFLNSLCGTPA